MSKMTIVIALVVLVLIGWAVAASKNTDKNKSKSGLSGTIEVDGSSTVFPITEAMAEEFRKEHPNVQINIGVSGTGGGFKRFANDETDISNASRPIKDSEIKAAKAKNVEYLELKVAIDGLAVIAHKDNSFLTCLTTAELKKIWEPTSTVSKWSDIRSEWPSQPIKLYGPGTDSGTFDYFTEAINGKEDSSRADYTASEDDNILVQGVASDLYSLGYFGYAYYSENQNSLKLIAVDSGAGCITPTKETIENNNYKPLSRPLFIYLKKSALYRKEVADFTRFYLEQAPALVDEVRYIPFPASIYQEEKAKLEAVIK